MVHQFPAAALAAALLAGGTLARQSTPPSAPAERYVFVENTDVWVGVIRGEACLIGKFDKNGDFTHEIKRKSVGGGSAGIPAHGVVNAAGSTPRKVYEFRSCVLIPGELRKDGNFVPEVGGKIIAFADYKYTPEATRIWNLPGGFVLEKPPEPKK